MSPTHGAAFRGFRDDEQSPFFCALGHTPEETWDLSVDRFAHILETLATLAAAGPIELSPALLCSWHREIFGELFPDDAGRLRWRRGRDPEHVYFDATAASILESTPIDTYDAVHAATRLYAKVLRAHPFVDGNLRGTSVALNAALLTLGLTRIQVTDLELHDRLLAIAFAGRHDPYRPLAEYIATLTNKPDGP
jgi:prophage maintenance system killer protein